MKGLKGSAQIQTNNTKKGRTKKDFTFHSPHQVDLLSDSEYGYYTFITVQILWEYLPTLASVVFFRVKKPMVSLYSKIWPLCYQFGEGKVKVCMTCIKLLH